MELQGGERERWRHLVAAGILGVSQPPGKKPHLIGDGSISGSNSHSYIREKVSLPTLECLRRLLSLFPADDAWCALSLDVRGAHKLVLVCDDEQGLSCFVLKGRWLVYRSCYFGCKWAAYWFSRVGGFLVRHLHRFIWVAHALLLYSDDGLELFPSQVAPLLALVSVMFLTALGVPLSWEKLALGTKIPWIGWLFDLSNRCASLPEDKRRKALEILQVLMCSGKKIEKKLVEKAIGWLLWFTGGPLWLRPWLREFYELLKKPRVALHMLTPCQFAEAVGCLGMKMLVLSPPAQSDVLVGWRLHSVNNCEVKSVQCNAIAHPCVRSNGISTVWYNYDSKWTLTCSSSAAAAALLYKCIEDCVPVPLRVLQPVEGICAADAFASTSKAGIGGWWCPGVVFKANEVRWFSLQLSKSDLPSWLRADSSTGLQAFIASFEAFAKLVLL